ncbi:MAG: hypothetical protein KDI03_12125 [Anaerolineae bacterium]|nr:hypothetical protein [Anaerolineae bacterium]
MSKEPRSVDLFGEFYAEPVTRVRLYADEIKPYTNGLGEKWMYIGILAIPDDRWEKAISWLLEDRQESRYYDEVHFVKLRNYSYAHVHNAKTLLAKRWVRRVVWDADKMFHFYLLGLNLSNLQARAFGDGSDRERNIYNRFFRSSVFYVLKSFFGPTNVQVTGIFHDVSDLRNDSLFDWHTIWRLGTHETGLDFRTDKIYFINSDHHQETEYPEHSHFIQLCDTLTGGFTHCLDARNKKDGCREVASDLLPLAERLNDTKQANNHNSRYQYVRRMAISYFPSKRLTLAQIEEDFQRVQSGFYKGRRLLLADQLTGQSCLF